jgi:bacillithiol biosynthesis cysteine-adding enzyme BshC
VPPEPLAAAASAIRVDLRRFPWIRKLPIDYACHYDRLAKFYAGDPSSPEAWRLAAGRARNRTIDRDALVDVLSRQQNLRGAPAEAKLAATRLRDNRSVAIVTGQQAGLFGGPVYTLLKALTAIRLAEDLERREGSPAVAVFWIDSEDHDWNEVRSTSVLDAQCELRSIALPERTDAVPVASVVLDGSIDAALSALSEALAPTEFTSELLDGLRRAYRPGVGMSQAFGTWLESVLGPLGLVVFDCADPAAKPMAAATFAHEFAHPGRTSELAAAAGQELTALGYHPQVTPQDGGVALFSLDGARRPIQRQGDRFVVPGTPERTIDPADAVSHPERFSPNVLLRPIVQDALFPTVCYVGGPSELAYLGQLRRVYEHFGVAMPLICPRGTATLLDSAAARFLNRYDLPLEQLQHQDEGALNRLLEAQLPPTVEDAFEAAVTAVRDRLGALIGAVPSLDPTLEGAARSTLGKMEHDLQTLHSKIIQAAKRKDETLRRQFIRTRALTFPGGHPQERTLGFVYFLNRFGSALVDRLRTEIQLDGTAHWLIAI